MAHLIDKDALVAKIEKLMYAANLEADIASTGDCFDENIAEAKYQLYKYILDIINSLEVKEVDLEKEIDENYQKDTSTLKTKKRYAEIAKHFFELGLKAKQE